MFVSWQLLWNGKEMFSSDSFCEPNVLLMQMYQLHENLAKNHHAGGGGAGSPPPRLPLCFYRCDVWFNRPKQTDILWFCWIIQMWNDSCSLNTVPQLTGTHAHGHKESSKAIRLQIKIHGSNSIVKTINNHKKSFPCKGKVENSFICPYHTWLASILRL